MFLVYIALVNSEDDALRRTAKAPLVYLIPSSYSFLEFGPGTSFSGRTNKSWNP